MDRTRATEDSRAVTEDRPRAATEDSRVARVATVLELPTAARDSTKRLDTVPILSVLS